MVLTNMLNGRPWLTMVFEHHGKPLLTGIKLRATSDKIQCFFLRNRPKDFIFLFRVETLRMKTPE
jgi:hypothetical protein